MLSICFVPVFISTMNTVSRYIPLPNPNALKTKGLDHSPQRQLWLVIKAWFCFPSHSIYVVVWPVQITIWFPNWTDAAMSKIVSNSRNMPLLILIKVKKIV